MPDFVSMRNPFDMDFERRSIFLTKSRGEMEALLCLKITTIPIFNGSVLVPPDGNFTNAVEVPDHSMEIDVRGIEVQDNKGPQSGDRGAADGDAGFVEPRPRESSTLEV
ncbi:hypothetical protein RIF29_29882 [Crotalaria pallida]|uniref:Uncharacterized protein n=1 Tax=Crotalaria pallida TaxID=3830 RepID=A0AAN9I0T5_CROPI